MPQFPDRIRRQRPSARTVPFLLPWLLACGLVGAETRGRTIEFDTTQVTAAEVTVSPDGRTLVFTMLGHLFRLSVAGGTAEQVTFGPYYDTAPAFSPNGRHIAFVSDRDGSEGNVFVLEVATGRIAQVTHETWTAQPVWTPDGEAIVYLVPRRETARRRRALVRRVALDGGEPETMSAPHRRIGCAFHLPDGRLGWTVIERENTRIEVMGRRGSASTLRTTDGEIHVVVPSPKDDGLYCRRTWPRGYRARPDELVFLPLPDGPERRIRLLGRSRRQTGFAVIDEMKSLHLGESGRLWQIDSASGVREPIVFTARVTLEVQDPVRPPRITFPPGRSMRARSIISPRLSPDGRSVVFVAAGILWRQSLDGAPAKRLLESDGFIANLSFSPDGRRLAFVRFKDGRDELRIFDFKIGGTRTLAADLGLSPPAWSLDGTRLVFNDDDDFISVNVRDGTRKKLADAPSGWWSPRPHLSPDGRSLYYSANASGIGALYRMRLETDAKPERITALDRHLSQGLVSPDGRWLAFRRNAAIWTAPLGAEPIKEEHVQRLSTEGGTTFDFTPDSSALIYAAGNRVWRHPLTGGEREEIAIRLELQRPVPPPLLVRRIRRLDFGAGAFGPETTMFIEHGRIAWIGSEDGRTLPEEVVILDAGGRLAIPGLFDLHVHGSVNHRVFIAYGVTSVRDTGGRLEKLGALADWGEATGDPVPRYFYAAEILEGAQPRWGDSFLQIHDELDARAHVRHLKERGVHFIKVYPTLPWPLQRTVAGEARRLGLPVVGHGTNVEEITKSVTLGYAMLEHANFPRRLYGDVLKMFVAAGTRWDPTLSVQGGSALLLRDEPERLLV